MLETDEVDADFFTPSSSTSLANLFKKNIAFVEEEKDNTSLKYVPQLPPTDLTKSEESRQSKCILACALQAYEWLDNNYVLRGKLGFAIIKHVKLDTHNIVLYDSTKTTLSNATITSNFEINLKKNVSISYYDNLRKYWSIYATETELHKILQVLQGLGVNTRCSSELEKQSGISNPPINSEESSTTDRENETSNTDSTLNMKSKKSILKRMANMGQSVLPNPVIITKNASESSDSNQNYDKKRPNKHKHLKTISNRNHIEKKNFKHCSELSDEINTSGQKFMCDGDSFVNNQQIVAFTTSPAIKDIRSDVNTISNINDVSLLISEQRVSNSELRINLNKVTDKLDLVLDKLQHDNKVQITPTADTSSLQFQNSLVKKLLTEYEVKIKKYEDIISQKGFNCNILIDSKTVQTDELESQKDNEITKLQNKLSMLTKQYETSTEKENEYINEITQMKQEIISKNEEIIKLTKKLDNTSDHFQKSDDAKNKIKNIMNDTFQSISTHFDDTENYFGDKVKNIVALVIKKTTIEAISDM